MATDIDSLQIHINAESQKANNALDKLIVQIDKLASSLSGVNKNSFNGVTSGLSNLNHSLKDINSVNADKLTGIANAVKKISAIDATGLSNTAKSIKDLSDGLKEIGRVHVDASNLVEISNAMSILGRKKSIEGTANLSKSKNDIVDFVTGLNSVGTLNFDFSGIANLVGNLQKLGGKAVTQATSNLKPLKEQLLQFVSGLNKIGTLSFDPSSLADLTSSISKMGGKAVTTAITNIPLLAAALKDLMAQLSTAPTVSQNLIDMTTALGNLARTGASSGRAVNSLSNVLNTYSSSAKTARKHSFSLASAIGKVYATYWMLFRAAGKIKDAINISSDLTEVQNVVDVTFGKYANLVEDMSKTSITDFGMSELTVKEVSSRFQAMGTAMGFAQGKMADMSIELTKLTADMASFYNVEQKDVAEDLESVFTGQTRPLRTYGLDLTQATLKEWAMKNGLDANLKSMSQAEKTMLRYQYVLANTGAAQGDFARTANTWANQVRILKQNFEALGSVIGGTFINFLKPVVKALNAVISKLREFAKVVSNSLGVIFGWKYEDSSGGMTSDVESAEDAAGGLSGNLGKAADNAKKLKSHLLSIDELNVVEPDNDSGSGGSGGSGGGAGGADADGGQWTKVDSIFKNYESELDTLYKLGEYIGNSLTKTLNNIPWENVYEGARNFGKGLADFLNGLISPELFWTVGKTVASGLNTAIYATLSFGETFDFREFGWSIATGINNFFATFEFASLAETINVWVQGIWDALKIAVSRIEWGTVWDGAKEFLKTIDMGTISLILGAVTIKKILKFKLGASVFSLLGTSISKSIAQSIAGKLGVEIAANAGIGEALTTGLSGFFRTAASKMAEMFSVVFSNKDITGIASFIGGAVLALQNFFDMWEEGFSWVKEFFMVVGIGFAALGAVLLGVTTGPIAALVAGVVAAASTVAIVVHDNWDAIKTWAKDLWQSVSGAFLGIYESAKEKFEEIRSVISEKIEFVKEFITEKFEFIKSTISNKLEFARSIVRTKFEDIRILIVTKVDNMKKRVSDAFDGIKEAIDKALTKAKVIVNSFKDVIQDTIDKLSDFFGFSGRGLSFNLPFDILNNFKTAVSGVIDKLKELFGYNGKSVSVSASSSSNVKSHSMMDFQPAQFQVPTYSTGGFPEDGWFRAMKGEYLGQFDDGTSYVANDIQIENGIASGVRDAVRDVVTEMLAPYLSDIVESNREIANKDFSTKIDGRALVSEVNKRSIRNGFSFT